MPTGGGKGGEGAKDWNRVVATPHPQRGDVRLNPLLSSNIIQLSYQLSKLIFMRRVRSTIL